MSKGCYKKDEKKIMRAWIFSGRNKTDINEDIQWEGKGEREREREKARERERDLSNKGRGRERISKIAAGNIIYLHYNLK